MQIDIVAKCGEVLFSNARHKALYGGRGSGKSWSAATYVAVKAAESSKRIVCARQFQNSIRDSSKELIEKRIRDLGWFDQFEITDTAIKHRGNDSRFSFLGLERNPQSMRSLEGADIIWVEEARTVSSKSLDILLPTIRKQGSELIWTWNPEQPEDPVDALFRGRHPPTDAAIAMISYHDNPWFDRTAMPKEMERLRRDNLERFKHVWEGAYDTRYESKVFPNMIVGRVEVPVNCPPCYGLDFGYTDPCFIVKVYVLEHTKEIYVAAEACARRLSLDDLPNFLRMVVPNDGDVIMADSAQPSMIEFLKARGFGGVQGVRKAPNSIVTGIQFLQGYKLVVDPSCEATREELRCYSWRVDPLTGQVRAGNPIEAFDHAADAIRYAISDLIERPALADDDPGVMYLKLW